MNTASDFEQAFAFAKEQAPKLLERDGSHAHMVLFSRNGKTAVVMLFFRNAKEKEESRQELARLAQGQADWYIEISEAWILAAKALDDLLGELCPSLNPKREEELLVMGCDRTGKRLYASWSIKRGIDSSRCVPKRDREAMASWLDEPLLGKEYRGNLHIGEDGRFAI